MDITWLGHSSFYIKGKSGSLVTDPYDSSVGFKLPKTEAKIVTVSHDHADHNQANQVQGYPRVVTGPGEYEIGGVSIFGIPTYHDDKKGAERGPNTVYVITMDNIHICHLGDLGHTLSEEQVGEIGSIDILFIPVGGVYTIDAGEAAEVVSQLEPRVVIPMHYQIKGLNPQTFSGLDGVEKFLKEVGMDPVREEKYTITYDKLPEDMQVVLLEKRG